jgi:hypothetical protein
MHTSARSDYLRCSRTTSPTSRTAVYGPVRTVVWQGRQVTASPMPIKSLGRVSTVVDLGNASWPVLVN